MVGIPPPLLQPPTNQGAGRLSYRVLGDDHCKKGEVGGGASLELISLVSDRFVINGLISDGFSINYSNRFGTKWVGIRYVSLLSIRFCICLV